jgi:hypothetical protein
MKRALLALWSEPDDEQGTWSRERFMTTRDAKNLHRTWDGEEPGQGETPNSFSMSVIIG